MGAALLVAAVLATVVLAVQGILLREDLRRFSAARRLAVRCPRDGAPAAILAEPLGRPSAPIERSSGWIVRSCTRWADGPACDGSCLDGPVKNLEAR